MPTCTSFPSFSTPTRSPIDIASIWSCVTKRKVAPSEFCRSFSSDRSASRSFASRFDKGSSIRNTLGSRTIARPIDTRCISPPESRSVLRSSRCSIRSILAARATRRSISSAEKFRTRDFSGNARFCRTV